jgi:hypothetical protein
VERKAMKKASLATLDGGGAIEAVDYEIQKVVDNILDVNTDAKKPREITLKIKLTSDKDRNTIVATYQATSKLQPANAEETMLHIGPDEAGVSTAFEFDFAGQNQNQHTLPVEGATGYADSQAENVTPIRAAK